MLTCRELTEQHASDYLDGCLPWRKRVAVRFHLAICSMCRRFIGQMQLVKHVLHRKPENSLPEEEVKRLAAKLQQMNNKTANSGTESKD